MITDSFDDSFFSSSPLGMAGEDGEAASAFELAWADFVAALPPSVSAPTVAEFDRSCTDVERLRADASAALDLARHETLRAANEADVARVESLQAARDHASAKDAQAAAAAALTAAQEQLERAQQALVLTSDQAKGAEERLAQKLEMKLSLEQTQHDKSVALQRCSAAAAATRREVGERLMEAERLRTQREQQAAAVRGRQFAEELERQRQAQREP